MIIPGSLKGGARRKKRSLDHEARRRRSEAPGLVLPDFLVKRKPSHVLFFLALLAIIGGLLVGKSRRTFQAPIDRSRTAVALRELSALRVAIELFHDDCGRYPTSEEGLLALINDPGIPSWNGPYVTMIRPDPWRRRYRYTVADGQARLLSRGLDGLEGTADDVLPPDSPLP